MNYAMAVRNQAHRLFVQTTSPVSVCFPPLCQWRNATFSSCETGTGGTTKS
jgi:hypothetical protein